MTTFACGLSVWERLNCILISSWRRSVKYIKNEWIRVQRKSTEMIFLYHWNCLHRQKSPNFSRNWKIYPNFKSCSAMSHTISSHMANCRWWHLLSYRQPIGKEMDAVRIRTPSDSHQTIGISLVTPFPPHIRGQTRFRYCSIVKKTHYFACLSVITNYQTEHRHMWDWTASVRGPRHGPW